MAASGLAERHDMGVAGASSPPLPRWALSFAAPMQRIASTDPARRRALGVLTTEVGDAGGWPPNAVWPRW